MFVEKSFKSEVLKSSNLLTKVVALLFFFFNSFLLPNGLTYTLLLTPIFCLVLLKQGFQFSKIVLPFCLVFPLIICIHALKDISIKDYLVSTALYIANIVFLIFSFKFVKRESQQLTQLFNYLTRINAFFVVIVILSLFTGLSFVKIFWYTNETSTLLGGVPRLKLLTTEASVYSLMIAPLFLYYFQYFYYSNLSRQNLYLLLSLILSLLLSLSYGVIGGLLVAIFIVLLINTLRSTRTKYNRPAIFKFLTVVFIVVIVGSIFFSDSGVLVRLFRIFDGADTSFNGRSSDSYYLANQILEKRSYIFGIGPGQLKVFGQAIFDNFYSYSDDLTSGRAISIRLPNAMADTYVTFGILGVILRISLQIFVFFKFKVLSSTFKLGLFTFLFIYQFFGSNISDCNYYIGFIIICSSSFSDSHFTKPKSLTNV